MAYDKYPEQECWHWCPRCHKDWNHRVSNAHRKVDGYEKECASCAALVAVESVEHSAGVATSNDGGVRQDVSESANDSAAASDIGPVEAGDEQSKRS